MPSLRTRINHDRRVLASAEDALADASEAVADATESLEDLASGDLNLAAITIGGARFVNNGGLLELEP
jgi:spermidine/putrescine-binding protein